MDNKNKSLDDITLQQQVGLYLKRWPWFIVSIIIMIAVAYTYLRYSTDYYQATASLMIKDTSSGGVSETWALAELDVLGNSFNTVENEIEILGSQRLMEDVVKDLNLNISYNKMGQGEIC